MAGNSRRKGATRKEGSKKPRTVGSGGQRRKGLEGKGPTPRATDRLAHPAAKGASQKRAALSSDRPQRKPSGRAGTASAERVAGRNAVLEALQASVPASALHVAQFVDSDRRIRTSLQLAVQAGLPVTEASRPVLDRLAQGENHQGIVLVIPPYQYADPDALVARARDLGQQPLLVALDGITDPRNLGAIIRSVAAFGGHGVVIPQRRSAAVTAAVWRSSAGTLSRVPVAQVTNLNRYLARARDQGTTVIGLAADAPATITESGAAADCPVTLVIGSEGKGLSRLAAQTCTALASIDLASGAQSLNASVAAGIALFWLARSRASAP